MATSHRRKVLGTPNYVLFSECKLGCGTMAEVVLARHKKKATAYAAKMFSDKSRRLHMKYVQREIDLLNHLPKHDNIVQLIGLEKEKEDGYDVIIMELCEGGSLQEILDKPENYFGLPEDEFLLVFEHLVRAIQHLHANKIIHRDIKPGNILLHRCSDGRSVYKLTDFNVSRYIDGESHTICGTEEFMDPQMHAALLSGGPSDNNIGVQKSLDLWSFAVTMYQCATGELPYRTQKEIREDRKMMQKLMTEKEAGVISQIEKEDGTIQSFKELPRTSKLLHGTRHLVTSILAKLMDRGNIWQPADFFREMDKLLSKKKLCIFSADLSDTFTVFLSRDAEFTDLHREATGLLTELHVVTNSSRSAPKLLLDDQHNVLYAKDIKDYIAAAERDGHIYCLSACSKLSNQYLFEKPNLGCSESLPMKAVLGEIMYFTFLIQRCYVNEQLVTALFNALRLHCMIKFDSVKYLWEQASSLKTLLLKISKDIQDVDCEIKSEYRALLSEREFYRTLLIEVHPCKRDRCVQQAEFNSSKACTLYESIMEEKTQNEMDANDTELLYYHRSQIKTILKQQSDLFHKHCMKIAQEKFSEFHQYIRKLYQHQHKCLELKKKLKQLIVFYEESISQHLTAVNPSCKHQPKPENTSNTRNLPS